MACFSPSGKISFIGRSRLVTVSQVILWCSCSNACYLDTCDYDSAVFSRYLSLDHLLSWHRFPRWAFLMAPNSQQYRLATQPNKFGGVGDGPWDTDKPFDPTLSNTACHPWRAGPPSALQIYVFGRNPEGIPFRSVPHL
jgi:hypothetical protein